MNDFPTITGAHWREAFARKTRNNIAEEIRFKLSARALPDSPVRFIVSRTEPAPSIFVREIGAVRVVGTIPRSLSPDDLL
jgi:hypothetical protein